MVLNRDLSNSNRQAACTLRIVWQFRMENTISLESLPFSAVLLS